MLLAVSLVALAADPSPAEAAGVKPPAVVAYEAAVADATASVRVALPRFAACGVPRGERVLVEVDLASGEATTSAPGAVAPGTASCVRTAAAETFRRAPPRAGRRARFVLDGGALTGDVGLFGTLAADAIEAGMRGVLDRVAQCYLVGLAEAPGIAGEVVVDFLVLPDGRAYGPIVKRTQLYNPTVESCVLRQVATAAFLAPEGDAIVRVSYPFTFNPP